MLLTGYGTAKLILTQTTSDQQRNGTDELSMDPTRDLDIRLRFFIAHQTAVYLKKLFTNICIMPFGSSVNGFGQIGCDLDLLCTTQENYITPSQNKFHFMAVSVNTKNLIRQKQFLETVGTVMNMCIPEIGNVRKILRARVPIIKFSYLATDTECDLCNSNTSALEMSKALYTYGLMDWRIKPLVCTIRTWARKMLITKEIPGSWITNYSLTMLVLFYLQVEKILPSLNIIEFNTENITPKFQLQCTHNQLSVNKTMHNNEESLYKLLHGFFQYYNSFNFDKHAICIREAKIKTKSNVSPMYIYNPYNYDLNISQNINESELKYMKDHIQKALKLLNTEDCTILNLLGLSKTKTTSTCTLIPHNHNVKSDKNYSNNEKQSNNKSIANEIDIVTVRTKEKM
ncbi:Poly(A) RNA polymerase, mitochondrial [Eufriesea mexicana]|uniref:Poly(A) RNA polymerase, mitochondrial n=1 Tax=Eufriesea mexicana TaxID=516756 RepID=A0A310SIR7_9HYME|nr:Poly(A) RNA polymerase, mitochondrial [Eufriesea mexicana]